ncbi:MAG: hypothetical protein K2Y39_23910 [Candidatus Obscuribacterales bacterium]|nr:hypothetical protein [Candidatus Obscuribacterales bacterium]
MGLSLEVGLIAWQIANGQLDEELKHELERLNEFLTSRGMQKHIEPTNCASLSFGMYGYSGLHYLRRIAAHLALCGKLPEPDTNAGEGPNQDPILREYFERALSQEDGISRTFDHLILHSDADGFYIPQQFAKVLIDETREQVCGEFVGSSFSLLSECETLANALELPLSIDPEGEEIYDAVDNPESGSDCEKWKQYGIESFTCIRLYLAANHSVETGAAIIFC